MADLELCEEGDEDGGAGAIVPDGGLLPYKEANTLFSNIPLEAELAFQDYLNLGSSRSVAALHNLYVSMQHKDPHAPVPATDVQILLKWETLYNWKILAWEYDAESNRIFSINRKAVLGEIYEGQIKQGNLMLSIARKKMCDMVKAQKAGTDVLTPQEALMYMREGNKQKKEAAELKLRLEDPSAQDAVDSGDFFDTIRKIGLLQINQSQVNIHLPNNE